MPLWFNGASEKDPLVRFAMQQRTLVRVKKLNSCEAQGEEWAKGCQRYPWKNGNLVVIYLHDEGTVTPGRSRLSSSGPSRCRRRSSAAIQR